LAPSEVVPYGTKTCAQPGYFPVYEDGGEIIGNTKKVGATTVQNALAQSSNTAFSDLAHRAGTARIAAMARRFGGDTAPYIDGGSGLRGYEGEVGMSLGIAPLTVNEQAQTLATIADDGRYHQAHLIKYWEQGEASADQLPKVGTHVVLSPS